jgi:hypothetical protein
VALAVAAPALVVAALAPAASAATSSTAPAVEICGTGAAVTQPGSITLACADNGEVARNLTWTSWGLGRHQEVAGELAEIVAARPLRERPRALLMLALRRSGRQAEAPEVYRAGRRLLIDELGTDPGRELLDLEHAILNRALRLAVSWRLVADDRDPAGAPQPGPFVLRHPQAP